ncbi:Zinc finger ccch domain-containing protein [Thalictrum thalictroides]|uniref:Zinc finger ccch domain-containing protein n=1 Tax=Thalictrum thalictroides TaxID=46969 RepID=A0A7J6XEC0_THATH|nr:Zinc finger ccch domain-containing protein [Thalictrum thalictroides]
MSPNPYHREPDLKRFDDYDGVDSVVNVNRNEGFMFGEFSRDTLERNQKHNFVWSEESDYRNNRRIIDSFDNRYIHGETLSAKYDSLQPSGTSSSRFTFGTEKCSGNGRDSLIEDRKRGSAKKFPKEKESSFVHKVPVSHQSVMEIVGNETGPETRVNDDGYRHFNGKRFQNQSRFGKFKKAASREGSQELNYTPKKKIQRTSALLRVGKTPKKWKDGETVSSTFFDGSTAGSLSHKEAPIFTEENVDQSKTEGSVDLDISFKSNALVAKAVVPPSGQVVDSDGMSTPNNNKKRKVMTPIFSVSSPRVTEIHEKSPNEDSSSRNKGDAPSSKRGLTHSYGKDTVSCDNITKECPTLNTAASSDNKELNGESMTQKLDDLSSFNKVLCSTHPKDKVDITVLGSGEGIGLTSCLNGISVPVETIRTEETGLAIVGSDEKTLSRGSSTKMLDAASSFCQILTQSNNEARVSGFGSGDDICAQPCLNEITVPLEVTTTGNTSLSTTVGLNKNLLIRDSSADNMEVKVNANEALVPSIDICTVSGSGMGDPTGSQPCLNETTESLKVTTTEKPSLVSMVGSDVVCAPKARKGNMNKTKKVEINEKFVLGNSITGSVDFASSSDKGLRQPDEHATVSGTKMIEAVGLQSSHGINILLQNDAAAELPPGPLASSAGTHKRKRRKKRGMGRFVGLSGSIIEEIHEKAVPGNSSIHGADYVLGSDKGLRQSEEKATVSGIETMDIVSVPFLHRIAVSNEKNLAESLPTSVVVGSAEVPMVKKNVFDRLSGFPSSGVTESCEGPTIAERLNFCVGASLNPEKDTEKSEEENIASANEITEGVDLQSLHCGTTLFENSLMVEAVQSSVVASAGKPKAKKKVIRKIKKVKKKHKLKPSILGLKRSQETGIPDDPKSGISCSCTDGPSISETGKTNSEEGLIIANIGTLDDVSSQSLHEKTLSFENSLEERSLIDMVSERNGVDIDNERKSADTDMNASENSTLPSGHALSSGFVVEWNEDPTSFGDTGNSAQPAIVDGNIESETGQRDGDIDVDLAGELGMPSGRKGEHIVSNEKFVSLPLDSQMLVSNERSASKTVENDIYSLPVKGGSLSVSTYISPREEASGASITNSNGEGVDSVPERHISLDEHSLSTIKEVCVSNSQRFQCHVLSKTCGPTLDLEGNANSDQTETENVIPQKSLPLPSAQKQQSTFNLRPKVGEMNGIKTCHIPSVPKVLPGRKSVSSTYMNKTNTLVRPRTWHRTDNPPFPQKVSSLSSGSLQKPPPESIRSTSYVRKGNSLVRRRVPDATSSQIVGGLGTSISQLNDVGRDELKSSTSDLKGSSLDSHNCLERPRTPPLPHNSKLPSGPTNSLAATSSCTFPGVFLEGGTETAADQAYKNEVVHIGPFEIQNDSKKSEIYGVFDSGKSQISKLKGITYVKRKLNQLVASSGTEVLDRSNAPEKAESLPSAPCDHYYKKKKNQLIRNAPSLGSYLNQVVAISDDCSVSESQGTSKISSPSCNRNINKQELDKAFAKTHKPSKTSLVWTLHGTQTQHRETGSLQRLKVYPYPFPWKRMSQWRNSKFNSTFSKSSFSRISKKLLLSRKRDTVYTRSTGGFSLRKSKVLSIGGSNLKWSKSIETRSKLANEEATLAVAAVERKKREQKGAGCVIGREKRRNQSSRERIFRIGSVRYKMDASKRTLHRIPDDKSSCAGDLQSGKDCKNSFIPTRLLIDNDEYIRIGNGNQLVRDPKKLVRLLASEKVRWSLHTARLRLARKQQYCQFYTRFGKCNKGDGKCPYIHDRAKIAVCTKFLKGLCSDATCKLTHKVIPERMEDCSYFLKGLCTNESCPYRHVNVNPNASVCDGFLRGYCASGDECRKKHSYVCPIFQSTGVCLQRSVCKLHHPKNRNKSKKRSKDSNKPGARYFGSKLNGASELGNVSSGKHIEKQSEEIYTSEEKLSDYISLDVSDEEEQDTNR